MTTETPSRATPGPNLAEVLAAALAAPDLAPVRRQNMASAVRKVGRVLDRPLDMIAADPVLLGRRLEVVAPLAIGMTKGSWANTRSLLRAALALTRPMLPGRHRTELTPEWKVLFDAIPKRTRATRLSHLLHWASGRGIAPAALTEADLLDYRNVRLTASLSRKPEQAWREVAWIWNKVAETVPGWPKVQLAVAKRRDLFTLPWRAFPPSLKADADAYLERLAGTDLVEDLPFKPVKQETRELRERQLRGFASALVLRGRDPVTLKSVADLVTLVAFKDGLRFFLERRGGKTTRTIANLASFLKSVARHWLRTDAATLDSMGAVVRRLAVTEKGMTAKNAGRLRPFEDMDNVFALVQLPERLMKEADSNRLPHRQAASLAQVAVAIEILLMAPLRLGNLVKLDLDRDLVRPGRARDQLHIVIEGHRVKNGLDLDYPLPAESIALIERYLERHHPVLAPPGCRAMFPGKEGGPKSLSALRSQIVRIVFRYTGLRMHPHLFRHAAAKLHLDRHPGEHSVMARVLGHRSIDMTAQYYSGLETAAAVRHFDETIISLRQQHKSRITRKPAKPAGSRKPKKPDAPGAGK